MVLRNPDPNAEDLWRQLEELPPGQKGEIIDGQLYVQPRPRPRHARSITYLGRFLGGAFDFDESGPGGWWIVAEPGIELPRAPEFSPDLAGWQRDQLPELPPEEEPFRTVPNWICEVLSTGNACYDQVVKARFYAEIGVPWLWFVDPHSQFIEVRRLDAGRWVVEGTFTTEADAHIPPFGAIGFPLHRLWV